MPHLVVGAATVEVSLEGTDNGFMHVGNDAFMFDGTHRTTKRTFKNVLSMKTVPMTKADADTLVGILEGAQPVTCSGDLLGGSSSWNTKAHGWETIAVGGGSFRLIVNFTLTQP